jgi:cell division protein FtsB
MTEQTLQRVADSVTMQLLARGGVIFLTVIALPFGIWAGGRLVDSVDQLSADVGHLKTGMAVIQADMTHLRDDVEDLKDDHDPAGRFSGPNRR